MNVGLLLYSAGLVVGLGLVGMVGLVAVRHRDTPGGVPLVVLTAGVATWAGSSLVKVAVSSYGATLLAEQVMYAGIVVTVAAFFAFALDYSGRGDLLGARTAGLLAVEPVLAMAAIATNGSHHLFWRSIGPAATFSGIATVHGPLFWLHVTYSYLLLLVGAGLLIGLVVGEHHVYRQQAAALTVAVVVPVAANLVYIFGGLAIDVTPLGFVVSGASLGWAVLRADFVQVAPVAREAVVGTMGSGVFVVDREGRLVDVNPMGRRMLGVEEENVVGRDLSGVLADRPELPESFAAMEGGPREFAFEGEEGVRHFEIEVSRLEDVHDRLLGRLVVAREVTERQRREDELRRQNERLDQFAAVVSHDLRNPLSVTASYIDLAMDDGGESDLRKAREATERMETIIDDVLALARDGEDVDPNVEVDVGTVAREAWAAVDTGDAVLDLEDPPTVRADRPRLLRALENLFRNAIEHASVTESGGGSPSDGGDTTREYRADGDGRTAGPAGDALTVTVGALPGGEGFYVADDGPGIPPERREDVLQPGESSSGGTGLGLAIVDTIVDGHGWTLSVEEAAAGGARFDVQFDG
jgi:PAS domain S-box-containing protein